MVAGAGELDDPSPSSGRPWHDSAAAPLCKFQVSVMSQYHRGIRGRDGTTFLHPWRGRARGAIAQVRLRMRRVGGFKAF